jgi:1-acyl-sn-glycerol-3-phosphate acyltransferase
MEARTGVARLSFRTGVPVLPLAVWGSQHVWQKEGPQSLRFGRPIWLQAGSPLHLTAEVESPDHPDAARIATDRVIDELARLVSDLRARYPKRWS